MFDRCNPARGLSIAATSLACLLAAAGISRAQSAEAEQMFEEGDRLMKQGKIAEACDAFDASNKLESRAGTLIRLGECREQNHQFAAAWSAYKDALTRVKDDRKKAIANAKLAELEPKLSYLTVTVSDANRIDGLALARNGQALDAAMWNRAIPVNGGKYTIVGRASGHEDWTTTVDVPDEKGKVNVNVPRLKEQATGATPPPPPLAKPAEEDEGPERAPTSSSFTTKRKIALGVAAGAVAIGVVGAVLGSSAKAKQSDAEKLCGPDPAVTCASADQANKLIKDGRSLALDANIAFGVAGAAAVVAGVLWFTGAPEARHVAVTITPQGTSFAITGKF
jgi:hypothetical protein